MNANNIADQSSTNTQPEENGVQPERTFTQEEVNRIVSERLARERAKSEPIAENQGAEDLAKRESNFTCNEWLSEKGYPDNVKSGLLATFDTSDADKFKENSEKLLQTFPAIIEPIHNPVRPTKAGRDGISDKLASIFRPKI